MSDPRGAAVHVAVGVIRNPRGEVLVSRRRAHVHQGGLWEFPGGKVEPGEGRWQALRRELREELDIEPDAGRPLIEITHTYPEYRVTLDVWTVHAFQGEPRGREGQALRWLSVERLQAEQFPAANRAIISAVRLPDLYAISEEPDVDPATFLNALEALLEAGVRLVQLRAKGPDESAYRRLARRALSLCRAHGAALLLNAPPEWVDELDADGVHLTSRRLLAAKGRPLGPERWVAASCHTAEEVAHACGIGVDFIVAGPVLPTASHPGGRALGWTGLKALTALSAVPVFALGGVSPGHRQTAYAHGAQGIAGISSLWGRARAGERLCLYPVTDGGYSGSSSGVPFCGGD